MCPIFPIRYGMKIMLLLIGLHACKWRMGGDLKTNEIQLSVVHNYQHWASIPKVVGSIPTVARHIFQACPVWIYTQSNITSTCILFT